MGGSGEKGLPCEEKGEGPGLNLGKERRTGIHRYEKEARKTQKRKGSLRRPKSEGKKGKGGGRPRSSASSGGGKNVAHTTQRVFKSQRGTISRMERGENWRCRGA